MNYIIYEVSIIYKLFYKLICSLQKSFYFQLSRAYIFSSSANIVLGSTNIRRKFSTEIKILRAKLTIILQAHVSQVDYRVKQLLIPLLHPLPPSQQYQLALSPLIGFVGNTNSCCWKRYLTGGFGLTETIIEGTIYRSCEENNYLVYPKTIITRYCWSLL